MKKPFLLSVLIVPMVIGCNKNKTPGLVNPFPNDAYLDKKIGFKLSTTEQISRPLTTQEESDLINTATRVSLDNIYYYDYKIKKESSQIHERNYLRAFAGEFKQGYSSSNYLNDEERVVLYGTKQFGPEDKNNYRRYVHSKSELINDYAYGQITKSVDSEELRYFMNYDESDPLKPIESTNKESTYISARKVKKVQLYEEKTDTPLEVKKEKEGEPWSAAISYECFNIKQSEYVSKPDANIYFGADKDDCVILVKETQKGFDQQSVPSGEEKKIGTIVLQDGRKYRANENTLRVSKLKLKKANDDSWYLVDYARKYTEVVITSKEIQPNQQIEMLEEPIVVYFSEEIHHFSDTDLDSSEQAKLNKLPWEIAK